MAYAIICNLQILHPKIIVFKKYLLLLFLTVCIAVSGQAFSAQNSVHNVLIATNYGKIIVQLFPDKAPTTTANFLRYVDNGFYDQTIFHRVIPKFMIQGGGFTRDFQQKATLAPIKNEANNGLMNEVGTLAMARTRDPHSATAQFFINVKDNPFLDHQTQTAQGWGYTVFGRVKEGMDIVYQISNQPTGRGGPFLRDVPQSPIIIQSITRLK
ncbi:MAG: peptidyl-prolyl cis-trans isomerase [Gammaproteobacteria bacterium]|nr:peptidyl-prolyl cis-trans isomerase [Gammaproteobacteria bacterium]